MPGRLKLLNPLNLISTGKGYLYHNVPTDSPQSALPFALKPRWPSPRRTTDRLLPARFSPTRMVWMLISALFVLLLLIGGYHRHTSAPWPLVEENKPEPYPWQLYPRLVQSCSFD